MEKALNGGTGKWLSRAMFALLAGLALGLAGCNSDGPTADDEGEPVTIQGTISDPDGLAQAGLFAHIVYGPTAAPVAVAGDQTDSQGFYSASGRVPADQCHAVQIWVLETSSFSAAAERLARELVGQCGNSTLDIEVAGSGPVAR